MKRCDADESGFCRMCSVSAGMSNVRAPDLQIKRDQSDQRDQCANAEVKRDLERGVVLPFARGPKAPIMMNVGTNASSWKK